MLKYAMFLGNSLLGITLLVQKKFCTSYCVIFSIYHKFN